MKKSNPGSYFFPLACLLASLTVLFKALEAAGLIKWAHLPIYWHGHEMLFGFAYALLGGYLLIGRSRIQLIAALVAWCAGRIAVFAPGTSAALDAVMLLAYPVLLAGFTAPPFFRAAKSGRNLAFPIVLSALALAEWAYLLGVWGEMDGNALHGLYLAAGLITIMLFLMGGRIIGAATSGAMHTNGKGDQRIRAAHPRLEIAGLVCLFPMIALDAAMVLDVLSGGLALVIAGIVVIRLVHWRPHRILDRPAVLSLHIAYGWLAIGLVTKGLLQLLTDLPLYSALHVLFIGALGSLGLVMMMRIMQQRARQPIMMTGPVLLSLFLISIAALARLFSFQSSLYATALWVSALCWGAAFLIAFAELVWRANAPAGD